ncbi:MAG: hypothetical protein LBT94_03400 [Prevotellaceae bacterium]|jgi:hypothetical protein|nr:hypothetical protein [Prevotellaceae bacterium]
MKQAGRVFTLGLLCCAHAAWGESNNPKGYDADHESYFYRVYVPDKSVQVGFTAGCRWYTASPASPKDFRSTQNLAPAVNVFHAGALVEKNFFGMRLMLATGLYASQLNSYLFGFPLNQGTVYIIDEESADKVHYTSIGDVRTSSTFISIPAEVAVAMVSEQDFGFYLKGSAMASFSVSSATKLTVDAKTPADVKRWLSEEYFKGASSLFIDAAAVVGIRWGSDSSPNFRVEIGVPFMLDNGAVSFLHTGMGFTARIAVCAPLSIFYGIKR